MNISPRAHQHIGQRGSVAAGPCNYHPQLQGNALASLDALHLQQLAQQLPALRALSLQCLDRSSQNGCCLQPDYKQAVLRCFPSLANLDGERWVLHARPRAARRDECNTAATGEWRGLQHAFACGGYSEHGAHPPAGTMDQPLWPSTAA